MRVHYPSLLVLSIIVAALFFVTPALSGSGQGHQGSGKNSDVSVDFNEETHLIFMREEEKLARDVYLTLGRIWPDVIPFQNIAPSEQEHTTRIKEKLEKYGIPDPNPYTDDIDSVGEFEGDDYGDYFAGKFEYLVNWGTKSELDALYVGAFIEELDMVDIIQCPEVIQTTHGLGEYDCGLGYTDNNDLQNVLGNLLEGSKNHLRSYVGNIEAVKGECSYEPTFLSFEEIDKIMGRECL